MRIVSIICATLFIQAISLNSASAQSGVPKPGVKDVIEDVRGRTEGVIEWGITKKLSLEAGVEARFKDDMRSTDRIHTFVGASYDICKYLQMSGEYILINMYDSAIKAWDSNRHRANLSIEGNVELGNVELSLRERLQTTFRTKPVKHYEKANPEAILRSRIMMTYNIPKSRWTPYLLFELQNTLNTPKPMANFHDYNNETFCYITRYRGGLGAKYRINRNNRLDFYYYLDFDRSYDIDYTKKGPIKPVALERELRHIFGISYKFKL
jgi:hypothetical protein